MDDVDNKILLALKRDAEIPIRKLSRQVRLSKSAVAARIRRLWEENIIVSSQYRLNYDLFGLKQKAFFFMQVNDLSRQTEFARAIAADRKNFPEVLRTYLVTGDYDIVIRLVTKNVHGVFDFINRVQKRYSDQIAMSSMVIVMQTYKECNLPIQETNFALKANGTDRELLFKLQASQDVRQIAKGLKLTPRAVYYKLNKYKDRGWLTHSTIIRNPHKLFGGIILIDTNPAQIDEIARNLSECSEMASVYKVAAHHNLLAFAVTPTNKEYLRIAEDLWTKVKRTKTAYVLDAYPEKCWNPIDIRQLGS